jgi:threonylcarbamoyladenosine tRNA methylthiotransferase MtaB
VNTARRPRVSFYTLGCKVNQYETRQVAESLLKLGYQVVPFGQPADACVVNTCAVTDGADVKSRAVLRRAARSGDDPLVIATGCYADVAPEAVAAIPGVARVAANDEKPRLAEIVDELVRRSGRLLFDLPDPDSSQAQPPGDLLSLLPDGEAIHRTRAVLKIQDGCNHFCSFCIIPFARGRLRSRPADPVLEEAKRRVAEGYRELVLAGICLGDYGDERGFPASQGDPLARLIEQLAAIPGLARIRLSSIDPHDVSADLIATLARLPQACRHLHLSLQSGDTAVLARMRRRYDADGFRRLVAELYQAMPDIALTTDVIVGFPGESEAEYQNTVRVAQECRFAKMHVFPYSPRQGTQAARWADDVPQAEKERRVHALIGLSDRLAYDFAARHLEEEVEILVESRDRRSGLLAGLTGNYLRVLLDGDEGERGQLLRARVVSVGVDGAYGERVEREQVSDS